MKIIYNRILHMVNLFGFLFIRKSEPVPAPEVLNHERIHTAQMKEMLYIPFYVWYGVEWLVRLFMKDGSRRNISLEREAYAGEGNADYLSSRHHYAWIKYLKRS